MKKARWILVAGLLVLAVLVGVGIFVPSLLPPSPGVTRANFDRIEDSMTFTEVEAICGRGPAQVFETFLVLEERNDEIKFARTCVWTDGRGKAVINFDQTGRVMSREWLPWHRLMLEKFQNGILPPYNLPAVGPIHR